MRRICLLICLALLSGLFHGAIAPMTLAIGPTTLAIEFTTAVKYHCDEQPGTDLSAVKSAPDAHRCCSGMTAFISESKPSLDATDGELINPIVSTLQLQTRSSRVFKPPKSDFSV